MTLYKHPFVQAIIQTPIHLLVDHKSSCTNARNIKHHVWSRHLPDTAVNETGGFGKATSPLFTLFTLASTMPEEQLIMAMYEMCGNFSVFQPNELSRSLLKRAEKEGLLPSTYGWKCVIDTQGKPTNLWKRSPLIDIDELHTFAEKMKTHRNGAKFKRAASHVTGVTSSPFEAQTSMLLALPKSKGGYGIQNVKNNFKIEFNRAARMIAHKPYCLADVLIEGKNGKNAVIECQGAVVHTGDKPATSDADRTTALQTMGYNVTLLSYHQITNARTFEVLVKHVAQTSGIPLTPKTELQHKKELALRQKIFIDWNTLGI